MKHIIAQFTQRQANPVIQFIKYGISGGVATVVHVVVFFLLVWKVLPALTPEDPTVRLLGVGVIEISDAIRARNSAICQVLTFIVSNMTAYLLNIFWVFERGRHHFLVEIGMFYAVSGVSLFAGTSLMGFLILHYKLSTTVAFLANLVTALAINFVMRKFVIFKG